MRLHAITFPEDRIAEFCRRHGVKRLCLFGSILRADYRPESDVDILVEVHPGRAPGMFGFGQMILELREIVGHDVDLRTRRTSPATSATRRSAAPRRSTMPRETNGSIVYSAASLKKKSR